MGALSNFIERSGVATASISLIREQSEAVRPPRALWVPFPLGRPLGAAGDAGFQKNVVRAALSMLETATEPTIEDYPVEAPVEAQSDDWVCPVSFPVKNDESVTARLIGEINLLAPWSAETRSVRGRTLFGVTGALPDQVESVARALGSIAEQGNLIDLPEGDVEWKFPMPLLIRHLADDLRTFYHEAVASQPGAGAPNHDELSRWLFDTTALGDAIHLIAGHLTEAGDTKSLMTRGFLIPEGYNKSGGSSFPRAPWREDETEK